MAPQTGQTDAHTQNNYTGGKAFNRRALRKRVNNFLPTLTQARTEQGGVKATTRPAWTTNIHPV